MNLQVEQNRHLHFFPGWQRSLSFKYSSSLRTLSVEKISPPPQRSTPDVHSKLHNPTSIPTQPPPSPSPTPQPRKPASKRTRSPLTPLPQRRRPKRSPIRPSRLAPCRGAKPPLHDGRRGDEIPAAAEGRVDARQEVVHVCGEQAGGLLEGHGRAGHDEGHEQHGVGEVGDRDRHDEDGYFAGAVVLRVGVG